MNFSAIIYEKKSQGPDIGKQFHAFSFSLDIGEMIYMIKHITEKVHSKIGH